MSRLTRQARWDPHGEVGVPRPRPCLIRRPPRVGHETQAGRRASREGEREGGRERADTGIEASSEK